MAPSERQREPDTTIFEGRRTAVVRIYPGMGEIEFREARETAHRYMWLYGECAFEIDTGEADSD